MSGTGSMPKRFAVTVLRTVRGFAIHSCGSRGPRGHVGESHKNRTRRIRVPPKLRKRLFLATGCTSTREQGADPRTGHALGALRASSGHKLRLHQHRDQGQFLVPDFSALEVGRMGFVDVPPWSALDGYLLECTEVSCLLTSGTVACIRPPHASIAPAASCGQFVVKYVLVSMWAFSVVSNGSLLSLETPCFLDFCLDFLYQAP